MNINVNIKDKQLESNIGIRSNENLANLNIRGRASTKERVNDLVSMKNELCNRNLLQVEQNVLYSGECDWPFCIRIASLENLMQVLESDSKILENKNKATYNGQMPPQFITKDIPKCKRRCQCMRFS